MNGISRPEQISILQKLNPDIAIIPEMKKSNIDIIKPDDAIWKTNNHKNKHPKGLVFCHLMVRKSYHYNLMKIWNYTYL